MHTEQHLTQRPWTVIDQAATTAIEATNGDPLSPAEHLARAHAAGDIELAIEPTRTIASAILDVEAMAKAIDPWAFRDHSRNSPILQEQCAIRRNAATLAAQRIRSAFLGEEVKVDGD